MDIAYQVEEREVKRTEPFLVATFNIDENKVNEIVARHIRTNIPLGERDDIIAVNVSAAVTSYGDFEGYDVEIVKRLKEGDAR